MTKDISMNIFVLTGIAYDKYCEEVGGVAFNGDPLPKWTDFYTDLTKARQSNAWIQAIKEVKRIIMEELQ